MCPKYKIQNIGLVNKTLCLLKELTYLTIRSNQEGKAKVRGNKVDKWLCIINFEQ